MITKKGSLLSHVQKQIGSVSSERGSGTSAPAKGRATKEDLDAVQLMQKSIVNLATGLKEKLNTLAQQVPSLKSLNFSLVNIKADGQWGQNTNKALETINNALSDLNVDKLNTSIDYKSNKSEDVVKNANYNIGVIAKIVNSLKLGHEYLPKGYGAVTLDYIPADWSMWKTHDPASGENPINFPPGPKTQNAFELSSDHLKSMPALFALIQKVMPMGVSRPEKASQSPEQKPAVASLQEIAAIVKTANIIKLSQVTNSVSKEVKPATPVGVIEVKDFAQALNFLNRRSSFVKNYLESLYSSGEINPGTGQKVTEKDVRKADLYNRLVQNVIYSWNNKYLPYFTNVGYVSSEGFKLKDIGYTGKEGREEAKAKETETNVSEQVDGNRGQIETGSELEDWDINRLQETPPLMTFLNFKTIEDRYKMPSVGPIVDKLNKLGIREHSTFDIATWTRTADPMRIYNTYFDTTQKIPEVRKPILAGILAQTIIEGIQRVSNELSRTFGGEVYDPRIRELMRGQRQMAQRWIPALERIIRRVPQVSRKLYPGTVERGGRGPQRIR